LWLNLAYINSGLNSGLINLYCNTDITDNLYCNTDITDNLYCNIDITDNLYCILF